MEGSLKPGRLHLLKEQEKKKEEKDNFLVVNLIITLQQKFIEQSFYLMILL
ncbi:MAG TPA: hypothetical protein QKA14_00070 [Candidatus Megaira endosymbiont of Hartmannula sinica]|nr:hypothetical protein [Candidatus Megaera endosymbiont of Hartmannula sinica]